MWSLARQLQSLSQTGSRTLNKVGSGLPVLSSKSAVVDHWHYSNTIPRTQPQVRFRWTKAKKKRQARFESRQKLAELGKPLQKPAGYIPRSQTVVNGLSKEEREKEMIALNEEAAAVVKKRLAEQEESMKQNPLYRHHFSGVQMSDRVRKLFVLQNGSQMEVVKAQKLKAMELFQFRPGDTGSSAVQVAALTARIQQMQTHMAKHKKDRHSKRGMDALFTRRRKILNYMERKDFESYRRVVKTLGLNR